MTVNFQGIARVLGVMLMILATAMIVPIIVAMIYNESVSMYSFAIVMIPVFLIGFFITSSIDPSLRKLKARDGYLIVSLCWILAPAISAIPLVVSEAIPSYIDAFFEMCSGYSTTGSTILSEIEGLPKAILIWRSFSHWLGGMGIIVFAVMFFDSGVKGQLIASAETPGPTLDKITPRFSDTAKNLYILYLSFTVIESILLKLAGMNLYDSIIHAFGTVGTGGFSNYNDSVAHFESPYIRWIIIVFMILCGTNFNLYFIAWKQSITRAIVDTEYRVYMGIIFVFSLLITFNLLLTDTKTKLFPALTDAFFQVASIITTTGFITDDYDLWPTFGKMLIFILMFIGASSSSTGGGVKVIRVIAAFKFIKLGINKLLHPNRIVKMSINGTQLQQDTASNIANFIFLFIGVLAGGTALISLNGFDPLTSFSAVVTCVGNIGPGYNHVGPTMNFSGFSDFSKTVLSFLMIAGRLELFTFFMLFSPHYWNSNKA